jgi:hypothetical protein
VTETLSHREIEQLLPAAALEILEGPELASVLAHAGDCAECTQLLAAQREVVAGLTSTLPEQPLSAVRSERVRARLVARVGNRREPGQTSVSTGKRIRDAAWGWGGWAVAAGMAGILMVHHSIHRPVAYGWLAAGLLMLVAIGLAVSFRIQQRRLSALRRELEREI